MGAWSHSNSYQNHLCQRCSPRTPPHAIRCEPPQLLEENVHRAQGEDERLQSECINCGGTILISPERSYPDAFRGGPFGTNYPPSFDSDISSGTVRNAGRANPSNFKEPPVLRGESTGLTEANLATHTNLVAKSTWVATCVGAPRYIQESIILKKASTKPGHGSSTNGLAGSYMSSAAEVSDDLVLFGIGLWSDTATDPSTLPTRLDLDEPEPEIGWTLVDLHLHGDSHDEDEDEVENEDGFYMLFP